MSLRAILLGVSLFVLALGDGFSDGSQVPLQDVKHSKQRVAIIGAGAAGSSAAYHLAQYAHNASVPVEITVYEQNQYVGGRSRAIPVYGAAKQGPKVELGASIFVEVNRVLMDAVKQFNLSVESFGTSRKRDAGDDSSVLGVWNGDEFVFTQSLGGMSWWQSWWTKARLWWRYGLAPLKTLQLMQNVTGTFFEMYDEPIFPWREGLSKAVVDAGLLRETALTGKQFLDLKGIGELFALEIIQASTRVNYAQNLGLIHGLETMVCMATDGAMSVEGGNYQIFEHMISASEATLHMSTDVFRIRTAPSEETGRQEYHLTAVDYSVAQSKRTTTFDAVILAAPYHQAGIQFTTGEEAPTRNANEDDIYFDPGTGAAADIADDPNAPPDVPYVQLHVTLFASPHRLSPAAFNLPATVRTPDIIMTTLKPDEQARLGGVMNHTNVGSAGFFSISVLRTVHNTAVTPPRDEYVYKIFSPAEVPDKFILGLLDLDSAAQPRAGSRWALVRQRLGAYQHSARRAFQRGYGRAEHALGPVLDRISPYWASVSPVLNSVSESLPSALRSFSFSSQATGKQHTSPHDGADRTQKSKDAVTWLYRHKWLSYPYLPPRVTFDEQRLDKDGLWYTGGIESFISTMETSALMGKNVARLMVDGWTGVAKGESA